MTDFCCPFCKKLLIKTQKQYVCENGHSFDIAKEGYVHLLPVNKMHSKVPGDTKEAVLSRRRFLSSGCYDIFSDALNSIVASLVHDGSCIIDSGCGEGYYTKRLYESLKNFKDIRVSGFDISKYAVKFAAKSDKSCNYAVASIFDIPVLNERADIVINIFAPIVEGEFLRILKKGGFLILAVPTEDHLFGLKKVAYENPYKNEYKDTEYCGFEFCKRLRFTDKLVSDDTLLINDLFAMTPYYWKTDKAGSIKIQNCKHLETDIGFDFLIYRKK